MGDQRYIVPEKPLQQLTFTGCSGCALYQPERCRRLYAALEEAGILRGQPQTVPCIDKCGARIPLRIEVGVESTTLMFVTEGQIPVVVAYAQACAAAGRIVDPPKELMTEKKWMNELGITQ